MVNRQARSVARVNVHCDINMIRRIKGAVEDSLFLYVRRLPHFIPNATAPFFCRTFYFKLANIIIKNKKLEKGL